MRILTRAVVLVTGEETTRLSLFLKQGPFKAARISTVISSIFVLNPAPTWNRRTAAYINLRFMNS